MKCMIVSCSHREQSESAKVAKYIEQLLLKRGHQVDRHDLGQSPLPFWSTQREATEWQVWDQLSLQVKQADSLILITPEWQGMATPQAKNFFLLASADLLAHKAGLIVSVSAGQGGAYPIAELRTSSYKNCKINWIPEHLIIRHVQSVLNEEHDSISELSKEDQWIRDRICFTLEQFEHYTHALNQIRPLMPTDDRFMNGM